MGEETNMHHDYISDIAKLGALRAQWWKIQSTMLEALTQAAENCTTLSARQKLKWRISTTDLEVRTAILEAEDPNVTHNTLCYVRDILELLNLKTVPRDNKLIGRFIDLDPEGTALNTEAQELQSNLRKGVKDLEVPFKEFSVPWSVNGIDEKNHEEYVTKLGQAVKDDLIKGIDRALQNMPELETWLEEITQHLNLCFTRASGFHGRADLCDKAVNYFTDSHMVQHPLIIYGNSGFGKTSLMAKVAVLAQEKFRSSKTPLLVSRFCGTSAQSSTSHALMENICEHVSRSYQQPYEKSHDYSGVITKFHSALKMGTTDQPLLVFIDSVDQLSDEDLGRSNLKWIPENLPTNCFLIVSTLPDVGGCFQYLQNQTNIPDDNYLCVPAMSKPDAEIIIGEWLKEYNRVLQPEQMRFLITLASATEADILSPLKLKLLFDIAKSWKSYETIDQLAIQMEPYMEVKNHESPTYTTTVDTLITGFFKTLEAKHGKKFVSCICGLMMSSCKGGLSESHLTDLVSANTVVMDTVLQYHNPPIRRLPQIVMSRLRNDIESYIVERGMYNTTVLAWFHRQFFEKCQDIYCRRDNSHHEMIAKYFNNELQQQFPNLALQRQPYYWKDLESSTTKFNHIALVELPWALNRMNSIEATEKFVSLTCNLHFIAVCCQAGLGRDLVQNFFVGRYMSRLMYVLSDKSNEVYYKDLTERLNGFRFFLSSNVANLQEYPFLVRQLALNMPDEHVVYTDAKVQELTDIVPWATEKTAHVATYKHCTKVQNESPCIHTLTDDIRKQKDEAGSSPSAEAPGYIMCIKMTSSGDVVVSGDHLGKIIIWSLQNGQPLYTLRLSAEVSDIAFLYEQNDHDMTIGFTLVTSTIKGHITMCLVDIEELYCDVQKGHVWQAHSMANERRNFEHVPIAVSMRYKCMITSGAQFWPWEEEGTIELCVWDFEPGRPTNLPEKVDLLLTKQSGTLLGNRGYRESYPLIQVCNDDKHLCMAVEQMHSDNPLERHCKIVLCTVTSLDVLFASDPVDKLSPNGLSIYVCENPSAMRAAVTFKREKTFKVLEIKDGEKDHFEGKVIFQSREQGKSLSKVLFISKDHVLFNEDTGLVNLNLNSKQYMFQGKASSTYLPGLLNRICCIEPVSNQHENHGIICTADRKSIKALNLKKLLEFQSQPINDRRLHPGPVRGMAGASGSSAAIIATWASEDGQTGQAEVRFWDARTNLSLAFSPLAEAIENTLIHEGISRGNIAIAMSADGNMFCYMDCYQLTLNFFNTENIRENEPTLLESFDLEGKSIDYIPDILSLSHNGSRLLVAGCSQRGAYLVDIPDDDSEYTLEELPCPGQLWAGRISPDGKYSAILCAEAFVPDQSDRIWYASYMRLFDSESCQEMSQYKAGSVETSNPTDHLTNPSYIVKPKCTLTSLDFLPDGKNLVTSSDGGKLRVFSVPDLVQGVEIDAHRKTITSVRTVSHKDVFYVVSGSEDGWVKLWKFPELSLIIMHDNAAEVSCVSACSNQAVITGEDVLFIQYGDPDGKLEILEAHVP